MADGTYTSSAVKAAAAAPNCGPGDCFKCDKTGLATLIVIPSVADKSYAGKVQGIIAPLLKGVADPQLTDGGYAFRTLRKGYLMAYYQDNPSLTVEIKQQNGWSIAQVDAGGYMTPTRFDKAEASLGAKQEPFSCSLTNGYASALLFVIPKAKSAGRVWVAFSSHPWSENVRAAYAKSETLRNLRMTCINAAKAQCARSIKLTTDNLKQGIADFAPQLDPKAFEGNPFPVRPLASEHKTPPAQATSFLRDPGVQVLRREGPDDVIAQAKKAIGQDKKGGFSITDAMIVAVPDPEGVTTTTAQRRITLCNTAAEWIDNFKDGQNDPQPGKKTGYWRLQSALSIEGLLKQYVDDPAAQEKAEAAKNRKFDGLGMDHSEYDAKMKSGQLPKDAQFSTEYMPTPSGPVPTSYGHVMIPSDASINREAGKQKNDILENLSGKAQGLNWQGFLNTYKQKAQNDKNKLARVEQDHKAWLESPQFKQLHEHDFDETTPADGMAYASCVSNCLMGGPITDTALAWWSDFLGEDPTLKKNLLVRGLLGNQKSFFQWFSELDQKSKTYDEVKGLLDTAKEAYEKAKEKAEEAEKHAHAAAGAGGAGTAAHSGAAAGGGGTHGTGAAGAGGTPAANAAGGQGHSAAPAQAGAPHESGGAHSTGAAATVQDEEAQGLGQILLNLANAVSSAKDKAGTLSDSLRGQLRKLTLGMMGKASHGLEAIRLQSVPVDTFARICESMVGEAEAALAKAGEVAGRKVKSVVLSGVLSLIMDGKPKSAKAVATLYLWVEGKDVLKLGKADGKYKVAFAEVTATKKGAPLGISLTEESAKVLAKNSMRLLRGAGAGIMSAGSGFLQALSIGEAVKKFKDGNAEDRQAAAISLVSGGLGLSAAFFEMGANFSKQFEKEVAEQALKRAAGIAAGFGSVMDATQAFINAEGSYTKGDSKASAGYALQGVFFAIAAGATFGSAVGTELGAATLVAVGLSWTGIALIFVALGVLIGFIILLWKDKPIQTWAKESIWGTSPKERFTSLAREQVALNEILIAVKIDFSYRSVLNSDNMMNWMTQANDMGMFAEDQQAVTREAWLRLTISKELLAKVAWVVQIYAQAKGGATSVVAQKGSLAPALGDKPNPGAGIIKASQEIGKSEDSEDAAAVTLSAMLDTSRYKSVYAKVRIAAHAEPSDPLLEQCDLIVDEQNLQG